MNNAKPVSVVVVDDESAETIADILSLPSAGEPNLVVTPITTVKDAIRHFAKNKVDVAVIDMAMPMGGAPADRAGLYLLDQLKVLKPDAETIVLTAFGSEANKVEAMKRGAFSYVDKTTEGWIILPTKVRLAAERKAQRDQLRTLER